MLQETSDVLLLICGLIFTIAYLTKGTYWGILKDRYASSWVEPANTNPGNTRDVIQKMKDNKKNCVVFYGSQTGTAEDYASRLAKEGHERFGLNTMVANLSDYDYDTLDTFPDAYLAIFVLATYGEGEPTDNCVDFHHFITSKDSLPGRGAGKPLSSFHYVAFGLGNKTYEHYNVVIERVTAALDGYGATRLGDLGKGDDSVGALEEDFLAWKDPMWSAVLRQMELEERKPVYEPVFRVREEPESTYEPDEVYLGEPNRGQLNGNSRPPYTAQNPYIAAIAETRELFTAKDRNCLHMEINIRGSSIRYNTGDHIAIWPTNANVEVDRFLKVFGLLEKRNSVISIQPLEPTAKVPFPTPTTYDAAIRYYIEIGATVSRQFLATLAPFAPSEASRNQIAMLGSDKIYFREKITDRLLNLTQTLEIIGQGQAWVDVPFSTLIEGLQVLQPRYYSISSSALVQPDKISITAVVEKITIPGAPHVLRGVTTNYLLTLKQTQHGDVDSSPHSQRYKITGPRNKYDGIRVPIHVRRSKFRLPSDHSTPVIMIGPGTGVAPFRAFVQERSARVANGEAVGKVLLFFGCRHQNEDFLYRDEWVQYRETLGDKFDIVTAFSRDGPQKTYVQHRLKEHAIEVNRLVNKGAYFYVCGDAARMAHQVNNVLGEIIAEQRGLSASEGHGIVKAMRLSNRYQEDVWS